MWVTQSSDKGGRGIVVKGSKDERGPIMLDLVAKLLLSMLDVVTRITPSMHCDYLILGAEPALLLEDLLFLFFQLLVNLSAAARLVAVHLRWKRSILLE